MEEFEFDQNWSNSLVAYEDRLGVAITSDNALVRRFEEGDGQYDHCLVKVGEDCYAIPISEHDVDSMIERGVPIISGNQIDEPTREYYIDKQVHEFQIELKAL
jgi:hypothetical protein